MTEPSEHAAHRPFIESMLRRLPGFRGYLEREYRRDSDRMVRDLMADRLQRSKQTLDDLARGLTSAGRLEQLPEIDRFRARLDRIMGRIRGAMQGYSGFFDYVQVDEVRLTEVYERDMDMVQRVEALEQSIAQLPEHLDGLPGRFRDLFHEIDKLDREWDKRDAVLKGWKPE